MKLAKGPPTIPPQCQAEVVLHDPAEMHDGYQYMLTNRQAKAKRKGYDWRLCSRGATRTIDGKAFCYHHAGLYLLNRTVPEQNVGSRQDQTSDG